MDEKDCAVCGFRFAPKRKNASCCSSDCSKRKYMLRDLERRKERRISEPEFLDRERKQNAALRFKNKENERARLKLWRLRNPEKLKEQRKKQIIKPKHRKIATCRGCSCNFERTTNTQRYCTLLCKSDHTETTIEKNVKNCCVCHDEFTARSEIHIYCSAKCKAFNKRSKQEGRGYYTLHKVKNMLKSDLGFTPPPDLVEEATALRLLRRSIKKAGE